MKSRTALSALLVAILVSASGIASRSVPTVVKESTLPVFQGQPWRPQIAGDWVLAVQLSKPGNYSSVVAMNAYNVATGEVRTAFEGKCGWPQVSNGYATWCADKKVKEKFFTELGQPEMASGVSNMVMLDLNRWMYFNPVLRSGTAYQYASCGAQMAYIGNGQGDVWYLNGGEGYRVSDNRPKPNYRPQINDGIIVWCEGKEYGNVLAYDYNRKKGFTVTNDASVEHQDPDTDGKTIVWSQTKPDAVWAYDIKSGKTSKIADGYCASLDNGVVVYLKHVGKWLHVFGKVLPDGQEFQISKNPVASQPHVYGDRVVWSDMSRIHWAQLDLTGKGK